jgi:hypothetical protein
LKVLPGFGRGRMAQSVTNITQLLRPSLSLFSLRVVVCI